MFGTTIVAVLSCTAMLTGCAADTTALDSAARELPAEHPSALQPFEVRLRGDTTAESVIPQIVAAGHEQLVTACEQTPGASVRIMNPLASGDYADVACSSILDGTGETCEALTSNQNDGPVGQVQQEIGPISLLACALGSIGTSLFTRYALCPRAPTEHAKSNCNDTGMWGSIGLTVVCTLPFLPIP